MTKPLNKRLPSQERKARIAVVGTGWWATYTHIPVLAKRDDVELVALVNRGSKKLQKVAKSFGVTKTYTDYHQMFAEEALDGVVVATSHAVHYDVAKTALEHNCHVLVEKPLTLNSEESRQLVSLANKRGKAIVMSCPWSYNKHTLRARQAVLAGEIGEIQLVSSLFSSWAYETYRSDQQNMNKLFEEGLFGDTDIRPRLDANTNPDSGGGQGWCQMSHSAALAFWVTGLTAKRVSAYMGRLDVAVDVIDAVSMKLSNGATGTLSSTGQIPTSDRGQHCLWVYGSGGYLILDVIEGTLVIKTAEGGTESPPPLLPDACYPRFAPANNFIDVVLKCAENHAPGEMGHATVGFLEAVYQSAKNDGAPVNVSI